jgi:uncharacterized delta-60 repeat protein
MRFAVLFALLPVAAAAQPPPGTLDTAFGHGFVPSSQPGVVTFRPRTDNGDFTYEATAVAAQPDGRIVVAGSTRPANGGLPAVVVARYDLLPDTQVLDPGFGFEGQRIVHLPGGAEATAIALQPDGRMLVAGVAGEGAVGTGQDALVLRLNADGTLDQGLGAAGVVRLTIGGQQQATGIALASGGHILLAARNEATDALLFRLGPTGVLDDTFGSFGIAVGSNRPAEALVLQADGRMVLPGVAYVEGVAHPAAARYRSSGTPDPAFAQGGVAQSPLVGSEATILSTDAAYVQDDRPQAEPRYRARFYLHRRDFDPGEAQGRRRARTFILFSELPQRRLAAIVLRRLNGAYAVMGRARLDDNAQADTPWVALDSAPHTIELDLKASSGPDANDGWFHLWVDGVPAATLDGLDNSLGLVDFVRLGALCLKGGASGTLSWDEFESRRQTAIGP